MRLLLDTHCWLWLQVSPERFRADVLELLTRPQNDLLLSVASAWEMAIKYALGRLPLPEPPSRYVPARMGGFMMGAYFVASGVSQYLGGLVATYASVPRNITDPLESLPIYTSLFNKLGVAALVCTAIAIAVLPLMNRLSRTHHEHAQASET